MGNNFRVAVNLMCVDYDQSLLLPENMRDWLPENHLVWMVVDAISQMDMSPFRGVYRSDGKGGAAYDPQLMLTLLLYAYTQGVKSARKISRLAVESVDFRVAAGNMRPDHSTISRFRASFGEELKEVFSLSLRLCAQAGLVDVGVIALDGTKLKADASGFGNVDRKQLEKMIDEYLEQCRLEDDEDDRVNSVEGDLADPDKRLAKLLAAKEKLAQMEAEEDRIYAEKQAALQDKKGPHKRTGGRVIHPRDSKKYRPPKVNLSDPDSKIVWTANGFIQGYNLQAVTNRNQIILATGVFAKSNDANLLAPMITQTIENLATIGLDQPGCVLADAGYFQPKDFDKLAEQYPGVELFVASNNLTLNRLHTKGRIPKNATTGQLMDRKMRTKEGRERYRPRKWMIEPVFSRLKKNLNLENLIRPSRIATEVETSLTAAAHNILKLFKATQTA